MAKVLDEGPARDATGEESSDSRADVELEELLRKMHTTIKIIGLGGGGSNTISRILEEGISGAELYAANTDAQHLLSVHVPHKILLGRRTTRCQCRRRGRT